MNFILIFPLFTFVIFQPVNSVHDLNDNEKPLNTFFNENIVGKKESGFYTLVRNARDFVQQSATNNKKKNKKEAQPSNLEGICKEILSNEYEKVTSVVTVCRLFDEYVWNVKTTKAGRKEKNEASSSTTLANLNPEEAAVWRQNLDVIYQILESYRWNIFKVTKEKIFFFLKQQPNLIRELDIFCHLILKLKRNYEKEATKHCVACIVLRNYLFGPENAGPKTNMEKALLEE